jgi:hypothetical protein
MSGEQLLGAKQNRVLNISIMVASKSDLPIPVSGVEAGRWRYQSRKFASSGTASQKQNLVGSSLLVEDEPIHTELFTTSPQTGSGSS